MNARGRPDVAHRRVLASAGSGKTYALTSRYLTLLAAGVPLERILATTFTRLAAGEILQKLLHRIVDAARDPDERAALGRAVGQDLDGVAVLAMLRTVAQHIDRVQIRTLDSLFGQLARSFAPELGLMPDVRVLDEVEAAVVHRASMARAIAGMNAERFAGLLAAITQGASDKRITAVVEKQVKDLAAYCDAPADAWGEPVHGRRLTDEAYAAALRDLEAVPLTDKRHDKARRIDLDQARREDWESFLQNGLAGRIASGNCIYYGKPIPDELCVAYRALIDHATRVLGERRRDSIRAARDLVRIYAECDAVLKRDAGVLAFDDVTRAVGRLPVLDDLGAIGYRLDALFEHVLLDEFQDTSVDQWRALAPILGEIVGDAARDRSLFCVGDEKQSIYGWRGATPEILSTLPTLLLGPSGDAIEQGELNASWRSAPPVIDVVNRIVGELPRVAGVLQAQGSDSQSVASFVRVAPAFACPVHTTERRALPGAVEIRTTALEAYAAAEKQPARRQLRLALAAETIADLYRRHPGRTIGVLTRTNAGVARLVAMCGPGGHGLPVSGRGGTPLTDAAAVAVVLDLLLLADDPDDTRAAFHVARSPLGAIVAFSAWDDPVARRTVANAVRRRLIREGYGVVLDDWSRRLASSCSAREFARLRQLVEKGAAHDSRATLRPSTFVRAIEAARIPTPETAVIEVMTVHQAKGLEFDLVVLPELEWPLGGRPPGITARRDGPVGPVERLVRWVRQDQRALFPEAAALCEAEEDRQTREGLCLLYVALTRAKQGLVVILDPRDKMSGTAEGVVAAALLGAAPAAATEIDDDRPGRLIARTGDAAWIDGTPARTDDAPSAAPAPVRVRLAPPTGETAHAARSASERAASARGMRARLRVPDDDALDHGRAVHRVLEAIEWIEDGVPDDATLDRLLRGVVPRRDAAWRARIVRETRAALTHPSLRDALSRTLLGDGATTRVWRERRFARRLDGRIQTGSFDRLLVSFGGDGRPAAACVIDFKTDAMETGEARAKYERQLADYRVAAAGLLGLTVDAVETRLVGVGTGTGTGMGTGMGSGMGTGGVVEPKRGVASEPIPDTLWG